MKKKCLIIFCFIYSSFLSANKKSNLVYLTIKVDEIQKNQLVLHGKMRIRLNNTKKIVDLFSPEQTNNLLAKKFSPLFFINSFINKKNESIYDKKTIIFEPSYLNKFFEKTGFLRLAKNSSDDFFEFRFKNTLNILQSETALIHDFTPLPFRSCLTARDKETSSEKWNISIDFENNSKKTIHHLEKFSYYTKENCAKNPNFRYPSISFLYSPKKIFYSQKNIGTQTIFTNKNLFQNKSKSVQDAFNFFSTWISPYPYKKLILSEGYYDSSGETSAIIFTKIPRGKIVANLQKKYSNWETWSITILLAAQWFGSSIKVKSSKDEWLLLGIISFLTELFFDYYPEHSNLLNNYDYNINFLSATYKDFQSYTAQALYRDKSINHITNHQFETIKEKQEQNSFLFTRQSIFLKQLYFILGKKDFKLFLHRIYKQHAEMKRILTPKSFVEVLNKFLVKMVSKSKREKIISVLVSLWTSNEWTDYSFENISNRKINSKTWFTEVQLRSLGLKGINPLVSFHGENGRVFTVPSRQEKKGSKILYASLISDASIVSATIDQNHHIYDVNRFNNHSGYANLSILPGSTNKVSPKDYTLAWHPFTLRRPSESYSLGIRGVLLKYTDKIFMFKVESLPVPQEFRTDSFIEYNLSRDPNLKLFINFKASSKKGRRLLASLSHKPLFNKFNQLRLYTTIKNTYERELGSSKNTSFSLSLELIEQYNNPLKSSLLMDITVEKYLYQGELQKATRLKIKNKINLHFPYQINYTLATFSGVNVNKSKGNNNVYWDLFSPLEKEEANLLIELDEVLYFNRIQTFHNNFSFPLHLKKSSLPFILSSKIRYHVFYDFAVAKEQYLMPPSDDKTILRSSGFGLSLPLGGDLIASGELTLANFSVAAILYNQVNERINKSPYILFNLAGTM